MRPAAQLKGWGFVVGWAGGGDAGLAVVAAFGGHAVGAVLGAVAVRVTRWPTSCGRGCRRRWIRL
ncbi:hypothetical protein, partial [Mycobacterium gordonae]|uniref:hypothetical protein n=1 Tax=Mycobacterium gordonae TaxID=1778 RepID=UPI001C12B517